MTQHAKVLVTGGTGFVGSHAVAALAGAGHHVRLLVRRPDQVEVSLRPLGVEVSDVVVGDVLDERVVAQAVEGCDALVHAAAVFSLDARRAEEMLRTNMHATQLVLGRAVERGVGVAVHVSSTVALTRYGGGGPDLPLGDVTAPYTQSKIASEVVARQMQEAGAPVVTIYPGAVYGPHDPYRGEQGERLRWILRGRFPFWPREGQHVVDARDVAEVIAAVLGRREQPGRYVVPGHHVGGYEMFATVAEVTGRRLPHLVLPAAALSPTGLLIDAAHRLLPSRWRYPADREGIELIRRDTRFDDSAARTELGVQPMSFRQSIADTVRWMVESGRVPARQAPRLRPRPTAAGSLP